IWNWLKLIELPIWSIKNLTQGNRGLFLAIDAINYLVKTIYRDLLEDRIKSILDILKHCKTDLKLLLNAEKLKEGFIKWLKSLENIKIDDKKS
ncbi:MAG: hypothetical protein N2380_09505, partial [bacterium]|nr:hypothetical protein [bacterium]